MRVRTAPSKGACELGAGHPEETRDALAAPADSRQPGRNFRDAVRLDDRCSAVQSPHCARFALRMRAFLRPGLNSLRRSPTLWLGVVPQSPSSSDTFIPNLLWGAFMSLTLIAIANRGDMIELTYEETVGDPHPFVLTVTSDHISRQTSKLPIEASDLEAYVLSHATELQGAAETCKSKGLTAEVLQ